jgi:hypothetical protein
MTRDVMTQDEWFAFMEQLGGLVSDPTRVNPFALAEIKQVAHELAIRPNPYDDIRDLRADVKRLEDELAAAKQTHKALKQKAPRSNAKQQPATRKERPA